ncbi:hypothetical protein Micbo1qcDRAFT_180527 [Microdochium bolleyi]|uniref:Uncharacterized protein n=1 Tax=Microdochium bolleyi TaxID=196109 RepID=A0A136ILM2_9PEZI|nr:hypothetical protein Micbo1qcDRAFT_180527 [Microdochium bolleyi]
MRVHSLLRLLALAPLAATGDVFVHYMGQGLNIDSAVSDVAQAVAIGVDAFALNVGQPDLDWSGTKLKIVFSLDFQKENVFCVPVIDQLPNYYTDPDAFWSSWSGAVDGVFTWEQAWPRSSNTRQSSKHYKSDHWCRAGDIIMTDNMTHLLALCSTAGNRPDFIQIQSWNDAGEGHYIGHRRHEGLLKEQLAYANQDEHPHNGWQPLFARFFNA